MRTLSAVADYGPLPLPANAWRHPDTARALKHRDTAALLAIAQQYTGVSQARIAAAIGLTQARTNEIMHRKRRVESITVLERIAAGLSMPDTTRMLFGLAPAIAATAASIDDLTVAAGVIARTYPSQSHAARDIRAALLAARTVDVLVVRGLGMLALNDSLLRSLLTIPRPRPMPLRVLLLDPDCPAAASRAAEIGETPEAFAAGVRLAEKRLAELAEHPALDVQVYRYARLPVWRVLAVDDAMFVGAFTPSWEGHASPIYRLDAATGGALHPGMRRTLDELLDDATRIV